MMNAEQRAVWRGRAPWIAIPVAAIAAFFLGGALIGDSGDAGAGMGDDMEPMEGMEGMGGMGGPPPRRPEGTPPEEIVLTERARALARVETVVARRLPNPSVDVRLLGRIDYDETRLTNVTAWTGGRIDRLNVQTTGEVVRRGQTIASLYSPEVYSAQQDLLAAGRQVARLANGSAIARSTAQAASRSANTRLALLGVPAGEIQRMARAALPARNIAIRTPFSGTVIERVATEGAYVDTGAVLYRVADLTRVWAQLEAYERDLATLSVGQTVSLVVEALPDDIFDGTITFMDPTVDPRRRIARVRVELDNADGRLLPGMFANAIVRGSIGEENARPLVIPESAPLFTGRRSVVYVERPGTERPTYDSRIVRLGPRMGTVYPVMAGLSEGERVVSEGAYFIDADLQIQGGRSMMMYTDDSVPGRYDSVLEIPSDFRAGLATILELYLALQVALAADDMEAARAAAQALVEGSTEFEPATPPAAARVWRDIAHHFRRHGQAAAEAETIEPLRNAFENISRWMGTLLQTFGNPSGDPLRVAECPMAFGNDGAEWFQRDERVQNAFFGEVMETCGEIRLTLEPGSYLVSAPDSDEGSP